jgi:protein-S-isoprenylcysteine O-methyltransferase Ste14
MDAWTETIISLCWAVLVIYWIVMAFGTKKTIERRDGIAWKIAIAILVFAFIVTRPHFLSWADDRTYLWHRTLLIGVLSDIVVLAGATFTFWARGALGRNWSAEVTFKQEHELITTGPYSVVRHPIYTGLLIMILGSAANSGQVVGFIIFGLCLAGAIVRCREEEKMMRKHFPEAYAKYSTRVHALIPFIL